MGRLRLLFFLALCTLLMGVVSCTGAGDVSSKSTATLETAPTPSSSAGPVATLAEAVTKGTLTAPAAPEQPTTTHDNPERGAELFTSLPCSGCHGATAQGQFGPTLAGADLSFEAVRQQVREPRDKMPAFDAGTVTDEDLRHIYAWLVSLPQPTETPVATLPPAQATIEARNRLFPEMDAASLAARMADLDEVSLRVQGEIVTVVEEGRFARVRLKAGEDMDIIHIVGIYDTALARQSFPATVGDRVVLYGVGAEPADVEDAAGSLQRLPKMQILYVDVQ